MENKLIKTTFTKPVLNFKTAKWEVIETKKEGRTVQFEETLEFDSQELASAHVREQLIKIEKDRLELELKLKQEREEEKLRLQKQKTNKIKLTEEQESKIIELWNGRAANPPSLAELIKEAFGQEFSHVSHEGIAVRSFLANRKIKTVAPSVTEKELSAEFNLLPEHKEFVRNNAEKMNVLELAKTLFSKKDIYGASREVKAIKEFVKEENIVVYEDPDDTELGDYKPPKSNGWAIARINKYVYNSGYETSKDYLEKLTIKQKTMLQALIGYLHNPRFIYQMNSYYKKQERELLEGSLIEYIYDKPDLTSEELEQYITLSIETVIAANILDHTQVLQSLVDEAAESEDPKFRMSLIEAVSNARNEYNQSVARKTKLIDQLTIKRSNKLASKVAENQSLVQLVAFVQEEEKRKILSGAADARKKLVKDEVVRLKGLNDIIFEVWGVRDDEVLNS